MKLFLYSFAFTLTDEQAAALTNLVGKDPADISVAVIDAAADVIPDSAEWVEQSHGILRDKGYELDVINLKQLDKGQLKAKLTGKDIIWVNAGNTFYLRWMLHESGADKIIVDCVKQGAVYAGWSAGAIVAGPTLEHIELMEETGPAPEVIRSGLDLAPVTIVPHMDNPEFADAAKKTNEALQAAGFATQPLTDSQVLVINGKEQQVI